MHVDLSPHLHSKECNDLIAQMQTCFRENRFKKFLFACDEIEIKTEQCLRRERLARHKKHNDVAIIERKEFHERLRGQSQTEHQQEAHI